MKNLNLSIGDLIGIVRENVIIGKGSNGLIYKLSDDLLFKFKYKDFIDDFEVEGNKIQLRKLTDISTTIRKIKDVNKEIQQLELENRDEQVKKLIRLKDKVKLTKLTQGMVFVDGVCVGYLLHNHKEMVNLFDYLENNVISYKVKKEIFYNIKRSVRELVDNNIFMRDLTTRNVMLNVKTNKIQIIDFEDICTSVREDRPKYLVAEMKDELNRIEKYMFLKNNENDFSVQ